MKRVKERIKYKYDQFISMGTFSLVFGLFLGLGVIILVISLIMNLIYPDLRVVELVWLNFMHTIDPGTLTADAGDFMYLLIMTITTFVGIFIFSLFISFILNGFQTKLESLKKGKSKVIEKNHTLILGWEDDIIVVVQELIEANLNQRKEVIVILSNKDTTEMQNELKENISNFHTTKIICRTGSIYSLDDLEMCSVNDAKAIILLEDDIHSIKALVALTTTNFFKKKIGHISSVFESKENMRIAKDIGGNSVEFIHLEDAITRIIAQTCLQPGLSYIYSDLFDFDGDEIYFTSSPKLVGKTFLEVQKAFTNSIALGYSREGIPLINPPAKEVLLESDSIIVIASDDDTSIIDENDIIVSNDKIRFDKRKSSKKVKSIAFIGYNKNVKRVLQEFDKYVETGSTMDILLEDTLGKTNIEEIMPKLSNIKINIHVGRTVERANLEKIMMKARDSIVIFSKEKVASGEKDSQTLLTLLHLRDIEKKSNSKFNIIVEITDVKDTEIINLANVNDFVISHLLASKMLAQISENRKLRVIFEQLLSNDGSEIYLKPAEDYTVLNKPVDFYSLVIACSHRQETFIGYKLHNVKENGGIVINPNKRTQITFTEEDCLIVLSED